MTRLRRLLFVLIALTLLGACLPVPEDTYEFDAVNLRTRECSRVRSLLTGFIFSESCGPPTDPPTAARLRELGVMPATNEAEARWVLIKKFTPTARGIRGPGTFYANALGATTFGTGTPVPAGDDLSRNAWVQWAERDPAAATQFWREARKIASEPEAWRGARFMLASTVLLKDRKGNVAPGELEALAKQ